MDPTLRKTPKGELVIMASKVAQSHVRAPAAMAKEPEEVEAEARARVVSEGGDPGNTALVLSRTAIQFGQYQGQTFLWLLENDVGYTVKLVAAQKKEREQHTGSQCPLMANKDALTRYSSAYVDFMEPVRHIWAYESSKERSLLPGQEGVALVGFGQYKSVTLQDMYQSKDPKTVAYVAYVRQAPARTKMGEDAVRYIRLRDREEEAAGRRSPSDAKPVQASVGTKQSTPTSVPLTTGATEGKSKRKRKKKKKTISNPGGEPNGVPPPGTSCPAPGGKATPTSGINEVPVASREEPVPPTTGKRRKKALSNPGGEPNGVPAPGGKGGAGLPVSKKTTAKAARSTARSATRAAARSAAKATARAAAHKAQQTRTRDRDGRLSDPMFPGEYPRGPLSDFPMGGMNQGYLGPDKGPRQGGGGDGFGSSGGRDGFEMAGVLGDSPERHYPDEFRGGLMGNRPMDRPADRPIDGPIDRPIDGPIDRPGLTGAAPESGSLTATLLQCLDSFSVDNDNDAHIVLMVTQKLTDVLMDYRTRSANSGPSMSNSMNSSMNNNNSSMSSMSYSSPPSRMPSTGNHYSGNLSSNHSGPSWYSDGPSRFYN